MAEKTYLDGIQYAIDLFEPVAERLMHELDEEHRSSEPRPVTVLGLRASFRAYGEVVGGLKMKRDQFAGREWQHRFVTHTEYENAFREASEAREKAAKVMPLSDDPDKLREVAEYVESLDRRTDARMVIFALSEDGKLPDDMK